MKKNCKAIFDQGLSFLSLNILLLLLTTTCFKVENQLVFADSSTGPGDQVPGEEPIGKLVVHSEMTCSKNELACPKYQTCAPYHALSYCRDGTCIMYCIKGIIHYSCREGDCPGDQQCAQLLLLTQGSLKKCFCPDDRIPLADGTCADAPKKCEGPYKDRYCDQMCVETSGNVTCSCGSSGFELVQEKRKFGDYGACIPESGGFGDLKIGLNGVDSGEWGLTSNKYITLNTPTAVNRVYIRSSLLKIHQIYSVTFKQNRFHITNYNDKGEMSSSYPIIYSLEVTDFAMDWPIGNVYYISKKEPKLTACNSDGTFCRILESASQLNNPSEIVIDPSLKYMFVADNDTICRMGLDGSKLLRINLPGVARQLTMDYDNYYLHYISSHDNSVYRLSYDHLDSKTVPQKILSLSKIVGEITSMATIGRQLYIAEYIERLNKSVLYHDMSTNPFESQDPAVLVQGPGKLKNIFLYHKSLVVPGTTSTVNQQSHLVLQNRSVCMEGFRLEPVNKTCIQINIKEEEESILLYTSPGKQLIQGIFVSDSFTCPSIGLRTVPINPIPIPGGSPELDTHMGYDVKNAMLYYSDDNVIRKAPLIGLYDRSEDTVWRATVGHKLYGIAIESSLRMIYYAEYSKMHYYVIASSLDTPTVQFKYSSSPRAGDRYFSSDPGAGSSYVLRVFGRDQFPVTNGDSMLHERSVDPTSGVFYDLQTNSGYTRLQPQATKQSERTVVQIGYTLKALSMGDNNVLHFVTAAKEYGMTNVSDSTSVSVCSNFTISTLLYIRAKADLYEVPSTCADCPGLCLLSTSGNYSCQCQKSEDDSSECQYKEEFTCGEDQQTCPGEENSCINKSQVCDGKDDCPNGADERYYVYCPPKEIGCPDNKTKCNDTNSILECINSSQMCDGIIHCSTGEDEKHCHSADNHDCPFFKCPLSGRCYGLESRCDGIPDCPEYSSEQYKCSTCQASAFKCPGSLECIPNFKLCDGYLDCYYGSDEEGCEGMGANNNTECGLEEKKCTSGQCVPEWWWCDGNPDCRDKSDEESCDTVECDAGYMQCNGTGQCVPKSWKCDTHWDCVNGEDERGCNITCQSSQFTCASTGLTTCLSLSKVCDGNIDCPGGDDETAACHSKVCMNRPCSHTCHPDLAGGYRCSCPYSMELARDNITCVHKRNLCQRWGTCSQVCVDLPQNQYKCTCHPGYTIQSDQYTCRHNDGLASLIFSNRHDLRLLPTEPSDEYSVLISSLRNTIAVDFHYEKNFVFWSDIITDKIYRGTLDRQSSNGGLVDIIEVITNGLPTAEGLAVDWIGDHIYWVESGLDIIEVADLDGSNRSTIISHSAANPMENPRSIAVDPRVGLLFWADWGIRHIRRSSMAGEDLQKLFSVDHQEHIPDGGWANGLTLDYDTKRVYWNDAKSDSIQTVDYNGEDFRLVLYNSHLLKHPFSISVFENWVYWSDWRTNSINRANKWNGTNAQTVHGTVTQPFDLKVFHAGRQPSLPTDESDLCANKGCSHLCLRNGTYSANCACPHLLKLADDGKTCKEISHFLLLSTPAVLTSISLQDTASYGVMPTLAPPVIEKVYIVDYYILSNKPEEQRLFWADEGLRVIATSNTHGDNPTNILDLAQGVEFGFSVDYMHEMLYIGTYTLKAPPQGTIDVCDFSGTRRATIATGLNRPKNIVLLPSNGTMFVGDEGDEAIYSMYMDGRFMSGEKTTSNILTLENAPPYPSTGKMQMSMSDDDHRQSVLYFGNTTHLYKFDGSTITKVLADKPLGIWSVKGNKLYTTSKLTNKSLSSGFDVKVLNLDNISSNITIGSVRGPFLEDMKIVDATRKVVETERVTCSSCNHHCLPKSPAGLGTCVCYTGYRYVKSLGSCEAVFPLLLYATYPPGQKLYGVEINSKSGDYPKNSLVPIPRIHKAVSVAYYRRLLNSTEPDYIYWIDSGTSISRSTRDLTDRKTIVSGLMAARSLTIDSTAGNLYWADSVAGTIEVCRTDGTQRTLLYQIDNTLNNKLLSIALHPSKGQLFYLESAKGVSSITPGKEKPTSIYSVPGGSALSVDVVGNRLFLCDGKMQVIYMDLDNLIPKNITLDPYNCSAVAAFGSKLAYSIGRKIWLRDMKTDNESLLLTARSYVKDITFAHEDNTLGALGTHACAKDNGGCEGLCLFNGDMSADSHCKCAMGVLGSDGKSCADSADFVVYSKVTAIEYHNIGLYNYSSVTANPYPQLSNNRTMNVIALATDPDRTRIYYSDIQRRAISWATYDGQQMGDILTNVGSVEGLAYDQDLLYFTYQSTSDAKLPAIKYIDLKAKEQGKPALKVVITLSKSDAPRAIAIHACSGYLFWTNWNEGNPSIQRVETSGAEFTSIITTDIVIPNGLVIDYKIEKLFWADASLDKIEMCDFLGQDRKIVLQDVSPHIFAMAIHGDYLYWTDWVQRSVRRAHKLTGSLNQTLVARIPQQLMGIAIASNLTCHASPCHGAPCKQKCAVTGNGEGYTCDCFEGYLKDAGNSSLCIRNAQGCDNGFLCHGDCIPWEFTCDGVNHCVPKSINTFPADEDPNFCATRQCPAQKFFTCRNQRCIPIKEKCNHRDDCGDLSDEFDCKYEVSCDLTTEFTCTDKQRCIPLVDLCDGVPQCWDKSDELPPHCNSTQSLFTDCSQFEHPFYGIYRDGVKCQHTPVCILEEWKCDGRNDCWDNSDEADCEKLEICSSATEWECEGGESSTLNCIQKAWVCDGEIDCPNGSDEKSCGAVTCPHEEFTCGNGECIPGNWRCDTELDCQDNSDEANCTTTNKPPTCSSVEYECMDKLSCVDRNYLCDGEMDCHDGSDEFSEQHGCRHEPCEVNKFMCGNGLCVPKSYLCDRVNDCLDNSDEPATCVYHKCNLETEFACSSGDCIPLSAHCNGWPDCVDGSDEGNSTCPTIPLSPCPQGQWKCPKGDCINETKLCDGINDCDHHDESDCFINECHEGNGGCNQLCIDEKIGFHCGCYLPGFLMSSDNRTCVDVNECVLNTPCSQICVNEPGSYYCRCVAGYELRPDKSTCKLVKGSSSAYLLVANRYYIRKLSLQIDPTVNASLQTLVAQDMVNAVGLDYDWKEQKIYWTDVTSDDHRISRMDFAGQNKQVLHSVTTKHPDGLAVDWIGRNIYWSDNELNTIEVSRLDSRHRKVLLRGILEPRALQLHPAKGYLFYTDWGQGAHIGRANMDGTSLKRIIEDNVGWPNALAVDIYSERLFFGDAKLDYIAMTDLDGGNRKMIQNEGVDHIFSLAVFEDSLYWSDWGQKQVHRVNKFTGKFLETLTSPFVHRPMELRIVHELNQVYKGNNPCDKLNCTGLCLLKPLETTGIQAVCSCPDYYTLASDNRTCLSNCSNLSQFECLEGNQCLHITQRCDGPRDCWDGSDEVDCDIKSECDPFQFQCPPVPGKETTCIDAEKMCDGQLECPYGEDEKIFGLCHLYTCMHDHVKCSNETAHMCLSPDVICKSRSKRLHCPGFDTSFCDTQVVTTCAESEFKCNDSTQCIPYVYHCDKERDCSDGSDEDPALCTANRGCKDGYASCDQSGRCIPNSWFCDGDDDCGEGQDEAPAHCDLASCSPTYFQCNDRKCIPERWRCDFENDCKDGSDEINCKPRDCSESEVRCADGLKCIHPSQQCDGYADCSDGSDEVDCKNKTVCGDNEFRCKAGGRCIPSTWTCDKTSDCPDHSDETNCTDRSCAPGEFQCSNSLCIPETFRCDGQNDCIDNSDESHVLCAQTPCLPDRFRCGNSVCIPVTLLCDGHDDCGDNTDELPLTCDSKCGENEFRCPNNGPCINSSKLCDGQVDCPYMSKADARMCYNDDCPEAYYNDERTSEFVCRRAIGGCMNVHANIYFIRAFHNSGNFKEKCAAAFKCKEVPEKKSLVKIWCEKGYEVNPKYALEHCRVCKDKNECLEYGRCSQICSNTVGGYSCSCQKGFVAVDKNSPGLNHDCVLDSNEEAPYLLMADGHALRSFDLHKMSGLNERPSFISHVEPSSRIDSVAVDLTGSQWTAYMLSYHSKQILKTDITSLQTNDRKKRSVVYHVSPQNPQQSTAIKSQTRSLSEVIRSNLSDTKSIAYDWIHRTLYWVDSGNATITMMHVDSLLEATIVTEQTMMSAINDKHINPQYITIDPANIAKIFWTDCCVKPRIWSADLDGGNPKMLTDKVDWPAGIVCDVANRRLYWTDTKHRTISSITVAGDDLRTIYTFHTGMQPSMIDVFGRELIVTSADRTSVVTLDKFVGLNRSIHHTNISTIVNSTAMHVGDIIIIHPVKLYQPERDWKCDCGPNSIVTETYHEDHFRCNCLCANNYTKINDSHCQYCPCINNGTCSNSPTQPIRCVCPQGFGGALCEQHLCKNYCAQGAECEVFDGAPFCKCSSEYTGVRCNKHKCSDRLCMNNGTCHVDNGGLTYCVCPMMYTGDRCQSRMFDLCSERGCMGERIRSCEYDSNIAKYDCRCATGYTGFDCENCLNKDNTVYSCHGRGKCVFVSGEPKCHCTIGHFEPITRCHNSLCYGYCLNGGTCSMRKNTKGIAVQTCSCPKYFTGEHCELRTKCITGYCQNGATCIEHEDKPASCVCKENYAGRLCDRSCQDGCVDGHTCQLLPKRSIPGCYCPHGRRGQTCQDHIWCDFKCNGHGKCTGCLADKNTTCGTCCNCVCDSGWTGDRCSDKVSEDSSISAPPDLPTGVTAAIATVVVLLILIAAVVITVVYRKRQRRQMLFEHLRLSEDRDGTMEISNPMYLKSTNADNDEEADDDDDYSVYSATNTSNFANPLFSSRSAKKHNKRNDERVLLIDNEDLDEDL